MQVAVPLPDNYAEDMKKLVEIYRNNLLESKSYREKWDIDEMLMFLAKTRDPKMNWKERIESEWPYKV